MKFRSLVLALGLLSGTAYAADLSGVDAINKAIAADLITKAVPALVPSNGCTPTSCTGAYVGFGIYGDGTNANIIGNGLDNSVFAGGVIPSINLGYQYAAGNWFFAGELDFAGQFQTQSTVNGLSGNQNGPLFMQIVKVGGNLSSLLGTQSPITIPPTLSAAVISPYVFIGPAEHGFGLGGGFVSGTASGAGVTFDIGKNWFGDLRYTNIQYGASSNAAFNFNSQNIIGVSFNYKFNRF